MGVDSHFDDVPSPVQSPFSFALLSFFTISSSLPSLSLCSDGELWRMRRGVIESADADGMAFFFLVDRHDLAGTDARSFDDDEDTTIASSFGIGP